MAPRNVNGNERSRPKIAAAYALTISKLSDGASSVTFGAMRMPPSAASAVPSAQASIEIRFGRAPFSAESEGSSTAARIAIPNRKRVKTKRRTMAAMMATAMVIAWCQVIVVGPRLMGVLVWKNFDIGRLTPGGQISCASPIMKSKSEIETTSFTVSVVPRNPRMTTTSRSTPKSGAMTPRMRTRHTGTGSPHSKRSCQ